MKDAKIDSYIDKINDFPQKGVLFYDISPLLANAKAWNYTLESLKAIVQEMKPDILVGLESRGFLLCSPIAQMMGLGFVMVRKKGKLPGKVISYSYNLEYGKDTLEIKEGLISKGQRVVILDDVLATGGTINATINLLETIGANIVGTVCIMELTKLQGRKKFNVPFKSLIQY